MPGLTRRDFLKLASLGAGAAAVNRWLPGGIKNQSTGKPNVLVFIFDAMSARNLSLYGYRRATTPNLEGFAERAVVYHNHHAAGNFTSPGTASLLTGMYPWQHRAVNIKGLVSRKLAERNIFHLFGEDYQRTAYTQNLLANFLLGQFEDGIETILPPNAFSLIDQTIGTRLGGDPLAYRAFDDFLFQNTFPPSSLVFGLPERIQLHRREARSQLADYPRGLPRAGDYSIFFTLEQLFEGLYQLISALAGPYLAYIHIWPPHDPYKPSRKFDQFFTDKWAPPDKPAHRLGQRISGGRLAGRRKNYDEFIANADAEFGILLDGLRREGKLENTYVVATSDHGEFFERGVEGHNTPLLYEPIIHVPLLIAVPGLQERQDVYAPTNCIDLLPSLLAATGADIPEWAPGKLLPGLGGTEDYERSTFVVEARDNPARSSLKKASVAMQKGNYKLHYYTGYDTPDIFELYDLDKDYEELTDLAPAQPAMLKSLKDELLEAFHSANSEIIVPED